MLDYKMYLFTEIGNILHRLVLKKSHNGSFKTTQLESCDFVSIHHLCFLQSFFDDLIAYVTGGPCKVLVLTKGETGEGVIDLWRQIIGPFDAAVAKDEEPER